MRNIQTKRRSIIDRSKRPSEPSQGDLAPVTF